MRKAEMKENGNNYQCELCGNILQGADCADHPCLMPETVEEARNQIKEIELQAERIKESLCERLEKLKTDLPYMKLKEKIKICDFARMSVQSAESAREKQIRRQFLTDERYGWPTYDSGNRNISIQVIDAIKTLDIKKLTAGNIESITSKLISMAKREDPRIRRIRASLDHLYSHARRLQSSKEILEKVINEPYRRQLDSCSHAIMCLRRWMMQHAAMTGDHKELKALDKSQRTVVLRNYRDMAESNTSVKKVLQAIRRDEHE